jgi:hypothetical protein
MVAVHSSKKPETKHQTTWCHNSEMEATGFFEMMVYNHNTTAQMAASYIYLHDGCSMFLQNGGINL